MTKYIFPSHTKHETLSDTLGLQLHNVATPNVLGRESYVYVCVCV